MSHLSRRSFLAAAGAAVAAPWVRSAPAPAPGEPKFRLGLVTYNVAKDWDLPTILRICKQDGIAAVECRTTHKHGVEPTLSAARRRDVKKQFADSGVTFLSCGSVCEFQSADPAVVRKNVEDCKRFVGLVRDLGGKGVKVRPNGVAKGHTPEQACDQIGKALIDCGKAAADAGIEIWVEVHGRVTALPKNMRRIMDACGHPAVGACWNSNPTDLVDGSLADGFELLAKHIKSCHINDLTSKYPYRDLFARLKGIGYDRYTLCEYGKSFDPKAGEKFLADYKARWEELQS
ncbi:MAG TPA: TIM barrel protein [Fimbriiglobus sp.]|nr:TIM barrel protein [Fimbriiglobus sp.]